MSIESEQLSSRERYHPRVQANFMVKVVLNGRSIVAKARDLSMNGLFIQAFPVGNLDRMEVSVPLPGDREVLTHCIVKRHHDDGVALEFEHLDWDDMFALARFLHPRLP